jgi:hypothetical protein
MSDLKRKGDGPPSPKELQQQSIGSGSYNRFAPLLPPPVGRSRIYSKRKYDVDHSDAPP